MIKKFRRKEAAEFEVIQYTGDNAHDVVTFVKANRTNFSHTHRHGCETGFLFDGKERFTFPTNDGVFRTIFVGDYLIKRPDGVWGYRKIEFEEKYCEVTA